MFFEYLLTLLCYNLSPGVSFVIVVRNTVASGLFKVGLATAFGVALSDMFTAVLSLFGCATLLQMNPAYFMILRIIGVFYLAYLALQLFTLKESSFSIANDNNSRKISIKGGISDGFFFTASNISVIISTTSILSQFINDKMSLMVKILYTTMIPLASLTTFAAVAIIFRYLPAKISNYIVKDLSLLNKISGIAILIFATINCYSIIGTYHK